MKPYQYSSFHILHGLFAYILGAVCGFVLSFFITEIGKLEDVQNWNQFNAEILMFLGVFTV